jgi:hypothetical protein
MSIIQEIRDWTGIILGGLLLGLMSLLGLLAVALFFVICIAGPIVAVIFALKATGAF